MYLPDVLTTAVYIRVVLSNNLVTAAADPENERSNARGGESNSGSNRQLLAGTRANRIAGSQKTWADRIYSDKLSVWYPGQSGTPDLGTNSVN